MLRAKESPAHRRPSTTTGTRVCTRDNLVGAEKVAEDLLDEPVEARRQPAVRAREVAEEDDVRAPFLAAVGRTCGVALDQPVEDVDRVAAGRLGGRPARRRRRPDGRWCRRALPGAELARVLLHLVRARLELLCATLELLAPLPRLGELLVALRRRTLQFVGQALLHETTRLDLALALRDRPLTLLALSAPPLGGVPLAALRLRALPSGRRL